MLATVVTKTFLDRWKGAAIGALSLALMFFLAMAVYRDIDLAVYTDLPEVFRALMNIPADADVGALSYIINPLVEAALKTTLKVASTDSLTVIDTYRAIDKIDGKKPRGVL